MLTNPVVISVCVVVGLSLLKLNVLLSLIIGAIAGGLVAGMSLMDVMDVLIGGMGGNAETALNYILLGALAAAISQSGVDKVLTQKAAKIIKGNGKKLALLLAFITIFSQNLIPVHIAFIPILIPPLIPLMNEYKVDRRAIASALTFGLKAPYVAIPAGFGLVFHGIMRDEMNASGMHVELADIAKVMWIPGLAMVAGLLIAVFISYAKPREYEMRDEMITADEEELHFTMQHVITLVGAFSAIIIQLTVGSLTLGAIVALAIMIIGKIIDWDHLDQMIDHGIGMMGYIAFVMLVAAGYGAVIRETGGVQSLVDSLTSAVGNNQLIGAIGMLTLGLIISLGIGTSFGTIPIIAAIYVPLSLELGFSVPATILLIGTAAALGDAGSPASDSTLGPTAGLNVDKQHDHIWDTCVPTFIHYNIPMLIVAAIVSLII